MKIFYSFLLFCFFVITPSVFGQNCSDYGCVIKKVNKAIDAKNYKLAFEQLESAGGYPNKNESEINGLLKRLFSAVEKEKQDAVKARDDAKKQSDLAKAVKRKQKRLWRK